MTKVDVAEVRRRHEAADEEQRNAWNLEEAATGVASGVEDALGAITGDERFDRIVSLLEQADTMANDIMREARQEVAEAVAEFEKVDEELGLIEEAMLILETTDPVSNPLRMEWAQSIMDGWTWNWFDFLDHHSSASSSVIDGVDMAADAYVRMRGQEWALSPEDAEFLEKRGVIHRDYDCEQNTIANGEILGPCYGITGESESQEERTHAAIVAGLSMQRLWPD